ncbi:conserved protein of unknown function [Tenacibaculum sp. 190130A14a]|uniref:Phytanoyl-CoA dioxygenase n=1 Tax=Tenacibaculum polynesiense TaxID=3137857 RepID=A0ABM9PBC1_9FLAO
MTKMKIFKDEKLNNDYLENGYVILKIFNRKQLREIKKYTKNMLKDKMFNSFDFSTLPNIHTPDEQCVDVYNFFDKKMKEGLDKYLTQDYEFFNSVLLVKKTKSTNFHWHIDPSFYDQKKYEKPFAIWAGIDKTTPSNGCLQVVPKSHKLAFNHEPFSFLTLGNGKKENLSSVYDELIRKYAIDVVLEKGEVIIHDQALIHASRPNNSWLKKRIAFKLTYAPKHVNEFEMALFDNTNNELNKYRFKREDLSYYGARTFGNYINNFQQMKDQLISQKPQKEIKQPFQSLPEMEAIMNTPLHTLKANFEL